MRNFEITFSFRRHRYQADVNILQGEGHLQYTISPKDEHLQEEFGNQVIHEFPGKSMQPAFPGTNEESAAYSEAIVAGLKHFLGNQ